jgi:hypothetical protein
MMATCEGSHRAEQHVSLCVASLLARPVTDHKLREHDGEVVELGRVHHRVASLQQLRSLRHSDGVHAVLSVGVSPHPAGRRLRSSVGVERSGTNVLTAKVGLRVGERRGSGSSGLEGGTLLHLLEVL